MSDPRRAEVTAQASCPLCRVNYPVAEPHACAPVEDVIVEATDPLTGERFTTWATLAHKDWAK